MNDITILSVANEPYFRLLEGMVRSAEQNFASARIVVELVNLGQEHEEIAKQWHSSIDVRLVSVSKSLERNFCTNRRAVLFKEYRKEELGHLVWLDADSIIRRPCDDLAAHILSCDLTMRQKTENKFAAGTIGIGSSDICKQLVRRYDELVQADPSWMSNQNNLNVLYGEFRGRINFKLLPKIYCDVWLSNEGVIWAAKSNKKYTKKYQRELRKYLS